MKARIVWLSVLVLLGCKSNEGDQKRLESLENRVQATEFQLATLAEMEPRLTDMVRMVEQRTSEWANRVEAARERVADAETRLVGSEQRLEQVEAWIREKEKEEEKEEVYATPDGETPDAWKELYTKCGLDKAGEAQTTLNFLVRIDRYMSEFPVHHPVTLDKEDPLVCMTSNRVRDSVPLKDAYRDRELSILKGRDQWLGYRIDRSWEYRPERGNCQIACCELDLEGNWTCEWGWDGGRWECEYDVEGWRNYKHRWHRHCDHIDGTRDFYAEPYLMKKMAEKGVDVPETLYCLVDLVWENRIYCLSHSQYPVMQIRLPEDPEKPMPRPMLPRFTVLAVRNWDVLYKDEWTSTWIITGTPEPLFPNQQAGLELELLQEPQCCMADRPEAVLAIERALLCIPEAKRPGALPELVEQHGFRTLLDYETQRIGLIAHPEGAEQLEKVRAEGCPQE